MTELQKLQARIEKLEKIVAELSERTAPMMQVGGTPIHIHTDCTCLVAPLQSCRVHGNKSWSAAG